MAEVVEESFVIDDRLRLALFGLECALGVSFNGAECEKVFRDAAVDQVSAKQYEFFQSAKLSLTGQVDQYEPDTIRLQLRAGLHSHELLRRVSEGVQLHYFRLKQSNE